MHPDASGLSCLGQENNGISGELGKKNNLPCHLNVVFSCNAKAKIKTVLVEEGLALLYLIITFYITLWADITILYPFYSHMMTIIQPASRDWTGLLINTSHFSAWYSNMTNCTLVSNKTPTIKSPSYSWHHPPKDVASNWLVESDAIITPF